jgi:ABC-type branched-subunit amino acid transport system ATPase component
MTPLQAVALAATRAAGLAAKVWQPFGGNRQVQRESMAVLERFDLIEVMNQRTRYLPYGKQRLLEIALAIACKPHLLLLDEPAAGVPESDRADIVNALHKLPSDVSILLVEHDMDLVFSFATHIWVLAFGQLIASGSVEQISSDPKVRKIYLGQDDEDD